MPTNIRPNYIRTALTPSRHGNTINRFNAINQPITNHVDGVFEGGAALGAAYIGSLRLLEQQGIWFKRVTGNSAGAITAAMIAAGYTANEIEWLCSSYPNRPARPRGVPSSLQPIDFLDFLDFPSLNTIDRTMRRKTFLWKALKGQVIDDFLNISLPVPTQKKVENDIINGLKMIAGIGPIVSAAEQQVRDLLRGALRFLPPAQPKLRNFNIFDTETLRSNFADSVWAAIASVNPLVLMSTQLIYEGSLFEGHVFLNTIGRLLGAKIHNNPDADVLFKQLPIPLAVIGANIRTRRMEVYSVVTHPNMIVAEAVRRSMSLPLIFEPRGNLVVDGGLCSNFPAWLFTGAGNRFWPTNSIDANRPKIGFTLDEIAAPPTTWRVGNGKFAVSGRPPRVNLKDVLTPLLIAKLRSQGLFVPSVSVPESTIAVDLDDWKVLEVMVASATMNQEESVRSIILPAMFPNMPYFHVNIPLLGFHSFDFAINGDKDDFEGIAERGWFAARDGLAASPSSGQSLLANPGTLLNPY